MAPSHGLGIRSKQPDTEKVDEAERKVGAVLQELEEEADMEVKDIDLEEVVDTDAQDRPVVKKAVETALPHVTVLESVADMYVADDPMFRGAWGFLRRGQLTTYVPHRSFTRLDERVVFATSDISRLFQGAFFDGAIESGLRAAREIRSYLAGRP